jgi:hypothetical protein
MVTTLGETLSTIELRLPAAEPSEPSVTPVLFAGQVLFTAAKIAWVFLSTQALTTVVLKSPDAVAIPPAVVIPRRNPAITFVELRIGKPYFLLT